WPAPGTGRDPGPARRPTSEILRRRPVELTLLKQDEGCTHIGCAGEVSQTYAKVGDDPLTGAAGPTIYTRKVLLDCRQTRFIDSSGLGWLLIAHKRFTENGGR